VGTRRPHRERITIRVCARRELGADRASSTAAVVDDDLLAEPLRKFLADEARDDVGRTTGRKRYDEADRLHWIALLREGGYCARHEHESAG
jgi:hypothetical protein